MLMRKRNLLVLATLAWVVSLGAYQQPAAAKTRTIAPMRRHPRRRAKPGPWRS
jgi:hypothetical protein